jgi:transposase-like protein
LDKERIRELKLKGLKDDEIAGALNIDVNDIPEDVIDIKQDTIDLYSALQRDLTKLTLKEMSKDNSDSSVILNAIKIQAELQEKKLALDNKYKESKVEKTYIYERDKEVYDALKQSSIEEVAKQFNVSTLSIKQAIDRHTLDLPEEMKVLSPSIISETIMLDKKTRLRILEDAVKKNLTRKEVREIVNNIKNKQR